MSSAAKLAPGLASSSEAGIALRIVALSVDVLILALVFVLLNILLFKFGLVDESHSATRSPLFAIWRDPFLWGGFAAAAAVSVIGAWHWLGGTPGALLMGVNVVRYRNNAGHRGGEGRQHSHRVGLGRCALRLLIGFALCGLGLLGARRGRRCILDRLCGTRAVRENEASVALDEWMSLAGRGRP